MTDQELLQHYRQTHDNRWLGQLFRRYTMLVFGVCMKYLKHEEEAKDCAQQVFEKAIAEIGKYDVTYFKSWLYMVAKNQCLMRLRDKGKATRELTEQLQAKEQDETHAAEVRQKETMLNRMHEAMLQLNDEQRTCIEMFYLQHKSYQEIASSTGYSLLQVKSYIQNGKRNLKLRLLQYKHYE